MTSSNEANLLGQQSSTTISGPAKLQAVACLLTAQQRAAVATIAVIGLQAPAVIQQFFTTQTSRPFRLNELRYGRWESSSHPAEQVVVFHAVDTTDNAASVGSSRWEIHCHGGELAANRILADLAGVGVGLLDALTYEELSEPSLLVREAKQTLRRALTTRTAGLVIQQLRLGMLEFVNRSRQRLARNEIEAVRTEARQIEHFAELGQHLTHPWRIVLAGPPNVGKSSLMNALVGFERSITYDQPGTTRDVVTCDAAVAGWPIVFSDTAGVREHASDPIEQAGIDRAKLAIDQADLVILVKDATSPLSVDEIVLPAGKRTLGVLNKVDSLGAESSIAVPDAIATSAITKVGIDQLVNAIGQMLVPTVPSPQQAIPLNDRQASLVRELIMAGSSEQMEACLTQLAGG